MSFLHPEFLLWLLLPTLVLFYFWLTQKPLKNRWLSEAVLEKLHAPETTMGLKGRNSLFLVSSLLIIVAMAQPVIIDSTPIEEKELHIILAIDRGGANFDQTRSLALSTLYTVLGEKIELIGFDDRVYRIAPRSNDGGILSELIKHLTPSSQLSNKPLLEEKLHRIDADMKIVVTSTPMKREDFWIVSSPSDVSAIHEKLIELRKIHLAQAHVPLFFYPLGLAMTLILFALSSMSKRQSVGVGSLALLFSLSLTPAHAGILDFKELIEAKAAYERGEYEKSEHLFARYQMKHDSPQVRYNRANALYMSGRFDRARFWYERVYTTDPGLKERVSHNLKKSIGKIQTVEFQKKGREKGANAITSATSNISMMRKPLKRETRLFEL